RPLGSPDGAPLGAAAPRVVARVGTRGARLRARSARSPDGALRRARHGSTRGARARASALRDPGRTRLARTPQRSRAALGIPAPAPRRGPPRGLAGRAGRGGAAGRRRAGPDRGFGPRGRRRARNRDRDRRGRGSPARRGRVGRGTAAARPPAPPGRPAMRRLADFVVGEGVLALGILGAVAAMGATPPALHDAPVWPFSFRLTTTALEGAPDAATRALVGSQVAVLGVAGVVAALVL